MLAAQSILNALFDAELTLAEGTLLGVIITSVFAALSARRAKRVERKADTAVVVAKEAADEVRGPNGNPTGMTVEATHTLVRQTSRLVETIDGRLHDVSKRLDAQGRELGTMRRSVSTIEEQLISQGEAVDEVGRGLKVHLEEVTPLVAQFIELRDGLRKEEP